MAYIKQRSNYVLQTKHKSVNEGTIWERDITTLGGLNAFSSGQYPIYQSGNFILTVNMENNLSKYIERYGWTENENGVLWTLTDVQDTSSKIIEDESTNIKLKGDYRSFKDFTYYGSCTELIRASISKIINTFPGEACSAIQNGEKVYLYYDNPNNEDESDLILGSTSTSLKYLFDNPFNIDFYTTQIDAETYNANPLKYFACNDCWKNNYQIIISGTVYDCQGVETVSEEFECASANTHVATTTVTYGPNKEVIKIYSYIDNDGNIATLLDDTDSSLSVAIRPKESFLQEFYQKLDTFEQLLVNPYTEPKNALSLEVLKENEFSYTSEIKHFIFPVSYGGYNLDINSFEYQKYITSLVEVAEYYDEHFCDNLYRSLTHEAIKNFDYAQKRTENEFEQEKQLEGSGRMQKVLRLIAREFDEIKFYIDNLRNANIISYNDVYNLPDYFYSDTVKTEGWDIVSILPFDLTEYANIGSTKHYRKIDSTNKNYFSNVLNNQVCRFDEEINVVYYKSEPYVLARTFSQNNKLKVIPYDKRRLTNQDGYFLLCDCNDTEGDAAIGGYISLPASDDQSYYYDECADTVRTKIKQYTSQREYTMEEVNNHFLKMLKLNSRSLLRHKGTIDGMEMMLGLFGLKSERFCKTLGLDIPYDYSIHEHVAFTLGIEDIYDSVQGMHKIDWYNSAKLISYDSDAYKQGKYESYQGLPVDYIDVEKGDGVNSRILFPYFSTKREIDGNPYYQMNGGWLNKYPYQFDKHDNIISLNVVQENEKSKTLFNETLNNIKSVANLNELFTLPPEELINGSICYVDNLSADFIVIDGFTYQIFTEVVNINGSDVVARYFTVEVINNTIKVGNQVFDDYVTISNIHLLGAELVGGQTIYLDNYSNGQTIKIYIITPGEYLTQSKYPQKMPDVPLLEEGKSEDDEEFSIFDSPLVKCIKYQVEEEADELFVVYEKITVNFPYIIAQKYKSTVDSYSFFSGGTQLFPIYKDINGNEVSYGDGVEYNMVDIIGLPNPSHYFKLLDINNKMEFGGLGWYQLDETDYDYYIANSIVNYSNGNNPHRGNLQYDNGFEYISYFTNLFKFALEDDRFDTRCFKNYVGMYEVELENIAKIGFLDLNSQTSCHANYPTHKSDKIHFFGNKYIIDDENILRVLKYKDTPYTNIVEEEGHPYYYLNSVTSGYTLSDIKDYEFVKNISESSVVGQTLMLGNLGKFNFSTVEVDITDENGNTQKAKRPRFTSTTEQEVELFRTVQGYGVTDQIINTKIVEVEFNIYNNGIYSKNALETTKYFDNVVIPYLTQMVPSNTILKIKYANVNVIIKAEFHTTQDNETVQLLGNDFNIDNIKDILIDGEYVGAKKTHTFNKQGTYIIQFELNQNITSVANMFKNCANLIAIDCSKFDTTHVTDMSNMFSDCGNLSTVNLSNWKTTKVKNMSGMFKSCLNLTTLDISHFDTTNVTDMSNMFYRCQNLTSIDCTKWNASNVTTMSNMFRGCTNLTTCYPPNQTSQALTNLSNMFQNCSAMTTVFVDTLNLTNVINMSSMFQNCSKIKVIEFGEFSMGSVTDMNNTFNGCSALTELYIKGQPPKETAKYTRCFSNITTNGILYYNFYYENAFKNGILKNIPSTWQSIAN